MQLGKRHIASSWMLRQIYVSAMLRSPAPPLQGFQAIEREGVCPGDLLAPIRSRCLHAWHPSTPGLSGRGAVCADSFVQHHADSRAPALGALAAAASWEPAAAAGVTGRGAPESRRKASFFPHHTSTECLVSFYSPLHVACAPNCFFFSYPHPRNPAIAQGFGPC